MVSPGQIGESLTGAWFRRGAYKQQEQEIAKKADEVMEFLNLHYVANELAGNLSGGQKKLLELGRTMMVDAKIVLLDEVEKAHPDVFNTLLQILEDGRLTDAQGRTVDFKNTIIIMTSNLGTKDIAKNVGFSSLSEIDNYEKMKSKVREELKRYFKPEFLNRIDETIVFHELTLDEVKEIVDLMLDRVHEQLKNSDLEVVLSDEAKEYLATEGYDKEFGARPLRRSIQRLLEDPLSEELLMGKYKAGSTIVVSLDSENQKLEFEPVEAPDEPPVDFVDSES